VNECVLSVFHRYESISLLLIEPLNLAFHLYPPVKYDSESKDSFSIHLSIHRLRRLHLQEFLLGEDSLLDEQSGQGLL
jgi:hypothetical protein